MSRFAALALLALLLPSAARAASPVQNVITATAAQYRSNVHLFAGPDGSSQFVVGSVPGAVDYLFVEGGYATIGPTLLAKSDSDATVPLNLAAFGTGVINLGNGSGNAVAIADPGAPITATMQIYGGASSGTRVNPTIDNPSGGIDIYGSGVLSARFNNGTATFPGTAPTFGSNTATSPHITLNGAAASQRFIFTQTAGINRILFGTDNSAEGGANAGSNFAIYRYDDAGGFIDQAFLLTRSTGYTSLKGLISFNAGTVAVTVCGTSPPGTSGNDTAGVINVGSGTVTACTVTFSIAKTTTPRVFLSVDGTTPVATSVEISTTAFIAHFASNIAGGKFYYWVVQ